jgi:3-oxoacyl-[acyl-carrier protein] reductase
MNELKGKVALVTGASRGIGAEIARVLAEAGCDVGVNYLKSETQANDVAARIRVLSRRAISVQADVTQVEQIKRMVARIEAELGPVDILVNNAGINSSQSFETLTEAEWTRVITTNLTSAFLVSHAVLPGMRARRWGRIIMLSSIAAQTGGVIGPHYAASKAGLHGLVHSYANLLAREGITVNAIAPALIETDLIRGNPRINPGLLPVGRFGTAEEAAQAAVLLACNGYITGQTINVNGGWYMS